jgi:YD repeat-containing protein
MTAHGHEALTSMPLCHHGSYVLVIDIMLVGQSRCNLCIKGRKNSMKRFWPVIALMSALFTACDEDKYDDDQYGDHCLVSRVEVSLGSAPMSTTTIDYDQYDRVIAMTMTGQNSGRMEVVYNNGMAFFDYFSGDQLMQTAEATLNQRGDLLDVTIYNEVGTEVGGLNFVYNSDNRAVNLSGQDPITGVNGSVGISWANGNPVTFSSPEGPLQCEYFVGQRSSFNLGVGNAALLFQPFVANFALMYSTDLIKYFNKTSILGETMHFEYDKDSDDKVREMYWSSTSSGIFGTTRVSYECHTSH